MTQSSSVAGEADGARESGPAPRIVFITGCGRSGTTILGDVISRHEQVVYLNDRHDLWTRPFPRADVWGHSLASRTAMPRIAMTAEDAHPPVAAKRFRDLLAAIHRQKPVLVEKLPINNFRLGFLMALVPDAYLINIVRHGVEVAYSIRAKAEGGLWWGNGERKWELLIEHAVLNGYAPILKHVRTHYDRGLLEWRMSVETAERYFEENRPPRLLQLRYEDLIADAVGVCDRVVEFLGIPASEEMRDYAAKSVGRQNPAADGRAIPPTTEALAGETLRRLGYTLTPAGAGSRA